MLSGVIWVITSPLPPNSNGPAAVFGPFWALVQVALGVSYVMQALGLTGLYRHPQMASDRLGVSG
jgi:hypothetical protein